MDFVCSTPSLGVTINVWKAFSVVVSDLKKTGRELGLQVGDIVVSINDEVPAQWLDGVASQLTEAPRPMKIRIVRMHAINAALARALESSRNRTPVAKSVSGKENAILAPTNVAISPKTAFAIAQATNTPTVSSAKTMKKNKREAVRRTRTPAKKLKGKRGAKTAMQASTVTNVPATVNTTFKNNSNKNRRNNSSDKMNTRRRRKK